MPKRHPKPESSAIIIIEQAYEHDWVFRFPRIEGKVLDRLHAGIDEMEFDPLLARKMFTQLLRDYPEFLDAYHHLALTWYQQGEHEKAAAVWKEGTEFALKLFPEHFSMKQDHLQWGLIENRPFLRLYNGHGLCLMKQGKTAEALEVFENIVSMNPHDNQGARSLAVTCYLSLNRPQGVLDLCRRYPGDCTEHLIYGEPLALFQLGRLPDAKKALRHATKMFPRIAEELLKKTHKRPAGMNEDTITFGGADQAYCYWQEHGKFWSETPGALEFLRAVGKK